jgi:hypothetical protein
VTKLQINLGELAFQAEGGDKSAQYRLGILFLLGESVEQDLDAAYRWLAKAGPYNGAHLLVERLARYQEARMTEKQSDRPVSIGNLWRWAAVVIGRAGANIVRTSNVLARSFLALNPWKRIARVRFQGASGASDFAAAQTVDSRFPEAS